jgi:hypothetical protein
MIPSLLNLMGMKWKIEMKPLKKDAFVQQKNCLKSYRLQEKEVELTTFSTISKAKALKLKLTYSMKKKMIC